MMKKILLLLAVALCALSACRKELPESAGASGVPGLRFEFIIEYPDASKAVKSGWASGDKVFVFFSGVTTDYLTLTYDGSAWGTPTFALSATPAPDLGASGTLTAVFLPYGSSSASATYSAGSWTFDQGADSYFLAAEKVKYYVTDPDDQPATVGATLYMAAREDYAQFYVPATSPTGTIRLACNAVQPAGLASISADGTVTELTTGVQGDWMTGYADTIDGEAGYYVSGKVAEGADEDCGFALEYGTAPSLYYKNYYKKREEVIAVRGAYKLPALGDWPGVQDADGVAFPEVGASRWAASGIGAADPWAVGSSIAFSATDAAIAAAYSGQKVLPSDAEWEVLLDENNAVWVPMTLGGTPGYLIKESGDNPRHYFFLPRGANYWTANAHYLQVPADPATAPAIKTDGAVTEACVRAVSGQDFFAIEAINAGSTITFNYADAEDGIQYKINSGTWTDYKTSDGTISLPNIGDIVYLRGCRTSYENTAGDTPLFTSNEPCYIYGNLMYLMCSDDSYLPGTTLTEDNAFKGAFTGATWVRTDAGGDKQLTLPATTLTQGCYDSMFEGCTSLTAAPALPATTLVDGCYASMFKGCSALNSAPDLPATTLVDECYASMFEGCTTLSYVFCSAQDISADNCVNNWLQNVAATGSFRKSNLMTAWTLNSPSGIPEGWTPILNWFRIIALGSGNITVSNYTGRQVEYSTNNGVDWTSYSASISVTENQEVCFRSLRVFSQAETDNPFFKCDVDYKIAGDIASLIVGSSFQSGSYSIGQFTFVNAWKSETHLIDASELVLSPTTLYNSSYKSLFHDCTNLVKGPKILPATSLNNTCYRNMFYNCQALTSAPIISNPTTYNASGWYQQMFYNCKNLHTIVFLDTKTYASGNFTNWVSGISGTGTFYVGDSSNNPFGANRGNNAIPTGWTVETYTP